MDHTPFSETAFSNSTPLPALEAGLPAGTRVVLEVPKPGGGFRCVTPTLEEFAAALLSPQALDAATQSSLPTPSTDEEKDCDDVVPGCPQCKRAKTRGPKGNWTCTPCHAAAVSAGRAKQAANKAAGNGGWR